MLVTENYSSLQKAVANSMCWWQQAFFQERTSDSSILF